RLSKAFDTTPESWLNQQMHFDIWQAERAHKDLKVEKLAVA
ncbi:MAG: addiction module antidote protein, HigA family, partial [Kiritimatiellae bacterium]|nr:addiction module antidote protein, HigA family [Kiritimatiellia bacterium]